MIPIKLPEHVARIKGALYKQCWSHCCCSCPGAEVWLHFFWGAWRTQERQVFGTVVWCAGIVQSEHSSTLQSWRASASLHPMPGWLLAPMDVVGWLLFCRIYSEEESTQSNRALLGTPGVLWKAQKSPGMKSQCHLSPHPVLHCSSLWVDFSLGSSQACWLHKPAPINLRVSPASLLGCRFHMSLSTAFKQDKSDKTLTFTFYKLFFSVLYAMKHPYNQAGAERTGVALSYMKTKFGPK